MCFISLNKCPLIRVINMICKTYSTRSLTSEDSVALTVFMTLIITPSHNYSRLYCLVPSCLSFEKKKKKQWACKRGREHEFLSSYCGPSCFASQSPVAHALHSSREMPEEAAAVQGIVIYFRFELTEFSWTYLYFQLN